MKFSFMSLKRTLKISCAVVACMAALALSTPAGAAEPLFKANPPPPAPPVDCSKPTMTPEQFVDMVHTIAMHGDLRDVPFVEKIIQQKLISQYAIGGDKPDVHWMMYHTDPKSNALFFVLYRVHDDAPDKQYISDSVADIQFDPPIFKNCQPLLTAMITNRFSGKVEWGGSSNDSDHQARRITFNVNNAKISIGYEYKPDNTVVDVHMSQAK